MKNKMHPVIVSWIFVLLIMWAIVYIVQLEVSKRPDPNWIPTVSDEELEKLEYGKKEKTKS